MHNTTPEFAARQMQFNNCHVLTIFKDWHENGAQYWRVFYGTEILTGFEAFTAPTRRECEGFALGVLRAYHKAGFSAAPIAPRFPIIAREHGHRVFQWLNNRNAIANDETATPIWKG